jgi:LPXTG-motif cell wall-anchored protein
MAQQPLSAEAQKALEGLADIATPLPVSWMPQTWAWAGLGVVLLLALAVWVWRRRRHALANRYRVEALRALSALERHALESRTRAAALVQIAALIKRTAIAAYTRAEVASLSGPAWVQFIHERGFRTAAGARTLLDDLEYRSEASLAAMSDADTTALVTAARAWIKEHRVRA